MIVGIDPSFQGTGIAILSDDLSEVYYTEKYDSETDVYNKHDYADGAFKIANHIHDVLASVHEEHPEDIKIIAEIPALATKSGAYLSVLHGMLDYILRTAALPIDDLIWVPCTACDSFVKNKAHSKTYLVNYCYSNGWVEKKKTSHDICTAVIFCHLYKAILNKEYKNSWFRVTR